jgi:hypothetical protein
MVTELLAMIAAAVIGVLLGLALAALIGSHYKHRQK